MANTGLISAHQLSSYASPIDGQSGAASVVLGNDNTTVTGYNTHDSDPTIHLQSSALASRPTAATANRKWMSYDTSPSTVRLFYDDGATWQEFNYVGTALTIASTSTAAVAIGPNGTTNPVLKVDASVASQASGLKITGSTATGTVALAVISSSTVTASLTIDALLTGTITLGGTSTGDLILTRLVRLSNAITTNGTAGDLILPNTKAIRGANSASTATAMLISRLSTDKIQIGENSIGIQLGTATNALGGGAAPTFGTIGASGPTAAGQNAWLPLYDVNGAQFWVPIWR